jgi:hypothetical protein
MIAGKSNRRENGQAKIMTVAEIEQMYPDEWVLLEITRERKHRDRSTGRLIAHSQNRDDLDEPYERFRADHPAALVSEFFTGNIVPEHEDVVIIL